MDNINVVIRVRPLLASEKTKAVIQWEVCDDGIYQIDERCRPICNPYNFNKVFKMDAKTIDIFEDVARPTVEAAMQGYNGTIFAYGQTASGKTHTMMGSEKHPGLIPIMVQSVFDSIENTPERGYLLRVSYTEIYNERVYDLLSGDRKSLNIREDSGQTFVENLKMEIVSSVADIMKLMRIGEKNRTFGATAMNPNSSRSHSIFRIIIESGKLSSKEGESPVLASSDSSNGDEDMMVSHLNLVDLAGSERTGQLTSAGGKFREGCAINTSLLALRNVIGRLSQGDGFVNFRDSKLTRILQSSLGGNAKTSIICTINPSVVEETHSTLKFASMAKCIKNVPTRNVVICEATLLKQYANEIENLQKQLQTQKKESLDQQMIKMQLEETSLRNKELEERISKMKDSVITSSAAIRERQRLRRETWGGFGGFGADNLKFLPQTPMASVDNLDICRSAFSLRTTAPFFPEEQSTVLNAVCASVEFGCQVQLTTTCERNFKKQIRLLNIQASFEVEKGLARDREHDEQMDFMKQEQAVIESEMADVQNENRELRDEINNLNLKVEGLLAEKLNLSRTSKLTPLRLDLNDSNEFNGSLGLINETDRGKHLLLPWSDNEFLEKLSSLEKDVVMYRQRATVAEEELLKLEQSSSNYRVSMERAFDELRIESEDLKQTLLKLQTELQTTFKQKQEEKLQWKISVANLELQVSDLEQRCIEAENLVAQQAIQLAQKTDFEFKTVEIEEQIAKISETDKEINGKLTGAVEHERTKLLEKMKSVILDDSRQYSIMEKLSEIVLINFELSMNYQMEVIGLWQKCEVLSKHCKKFEDDAKDDEMSQMSLLKEEIITLTKRCADGESRVLTLTRENEECKELLKSAHNDAIVSQLQNEICTLAKRCADAENKVSTVTHEYDEYTRLQQLRSSENDSIVSQLQDEICALTKRCAESDSKVSALTNEKDECIRVQQQRLSEGDSIVAQLRSDYSAILQQFQEAEKLLEQLKSESDVKEKDLIESRTELGRISNEMEEVRNMNKNLVNEMEEDNDSLKNAKIELDLTKWRTLAEENQVEIERLQEKVQELELERAENQQLKLEISDGDAKLSKLTSEYNKITKQLHEVEKEVEELKSDLEMSDKKKFELERELQKKLDDNFETCETVEDLQAKLAQEQLSTENFKNELASTKLEAERMRKAYVEKLKYFSDQRVDYQQDRVVYETRIANLIDAKSNLEDECDRLKDQIRRLQSSLDTTFMNPPKSTETEVKAKDYAAAHWDGTCMSGSGASTLYLVKVLESENERLKRKLLEGCQRCQNIRAVIKSKSQELENVPKLKRSPVKSGPHFPALHRNHPDSDEENKSWSPLKPVVTWKNEDNKHQQTPANCPKTTVISPWRGITNSYKLQKEMKKESKMPYANPFIRRFNQPPDDQGPSNERRGNFSNDTFMTENDCKTQ